MNFINSNGQSLIKSLKYKIRAFKKLKEADIKINSFTDNNYWSVQCVDVIEELTWLFRLVVQFSSKKFYPAKAIEDTAISENPRLISGLYDKNLCDKEQFKKPLKNYQDLNSAINNRIHWIIDKAMSKEIVTEKVVEKPVSKYIDKNTFFTSVIATFAIGSVFLNSSFNKFGNFMMGIFVCLIALFMINYKNKWFKEI